MLIEVIMSELKMLWPASGRTAWRLQFTVELRKNLASVPSLTLKGSHGLYQNHRKKFRFDHANPS